MASSAFFLPFFLFILTLLLVQWERRRPWKKAFEEIGLVKIKPKETIFQAALMLGALLLSLFVVSAVSNFVRFDDSSKVADAILGFDALALLLAVVISPAAEELFFRGFLQKRLGFIPVAIAFALVHFGYGSWLEIVGALVAGLVLGYGYNRWKNVYSCILAHVAFNAASVLMVVYLH